MIKQIKAQKRKTIMLLVTYSCNLRCSYCYEPKKVKRRMDANKAKAFIKDCVCHLDGSYTEFEVQFMGGEPLMEFNLIRDVSEWIWIQDWRIPLVQVFAPTNGTLLNEEMCKWMEVNKNRFCLGLSFDGNRLMQNKNRSESYVNVNLSFFANLWPKQSVKMTLSPDTIGHLYDGVMHLYENGLHYITADLAMGKNICWESVHINEYAKQLSKLAAYYIQNPNHPIVSLLDFDVTDVLYSDNNRKKHCSCGEQLTCIDFDGKEYACHLFAPISATPQQAANSLQINFSNYDLFESINCSNCLLKNVCTKCCGMNFICNGDLSEPFPITCSTFKIQFAIVCSMQLEMAKAENNLERIKDIQEIIKSLN